MHGMAQCFPAAHTYPFKQQVHILSSTKHQGGSRMFDQQNRIYCATQEATGKTVKAMTMKTMKATTMKTKEYMKATGKNTKATVKTKKAMTMKTMKATAKTIKAKKAKANNMKDMKATKNT